MPLFISKNAFSSVRTVEKSIIETSPELVTKWVPERIADSHKGQNGVVGVVGGSWLYHGAPTLTALASLRSGVDLVYLAVPKVIASSIRAISPNLIVLPLADAKLTVGSVNRLLTWLPPVQSVAMGPGLGKQRTEGLKRLVLELSSKKVKILLDADALTPDVVEAGGGKPVVITPHGGEFKRVSGVDLPEDLESRIKVVREYALKSRVTVILKGAIDVVSDGDRVAVNRTGCAAMSVGGTGDVLSGLVAGLMSKGLTPFEAGAVGAYLNGLAGERSAENLGNHILATDVIDMIPFVMKQFNR
ncbi:MAG: NAD(P)H-hydrate dehydratase [Thaumarchaeota archaeon]|nr:NAD(P)H-hydrate dehydratase [Nitrososphaerota archaeon]